MNRLLTGLALGLMLVTPTVTAAADLSGTVKIPDGAVVELRVERSRTEDNGRGPQESKATYGYRQTFTRQGRGYQVDQTMTGIDSQSGAPFTDLAIYGVAPTMTYVADETLVPVRMVGWADVVAKARTTTPPLAPALLAALAALNDEQAAASVLKEQKMAAFPQGLPARAGPARVTPTQFPNPLGGPLIDARLSIQVERVDAATQRSFIRITETLDPASASASVRAAARAVVARSNPSAPADDAALAAFGFERSTNCLHEIDLKTGLDVRSECEVRLVIRLAAGGVNRVDRFVITQTLVSP